MDWRTWVFEQLSDNDDLDNVAVFQTLERAPTERPFIVIRMLETSRDVGRTQDMTVWIHDNPGSYLHIDALHTAVRATLEGPVTEEGAIACVWQGDGVDAADDARGTIVRPGFYRLVGRDS